MVADSSRLLRKIVVDMILDTITYRIVGNVQYQEVRFSRLREIGNKIGSRLSYGLTVQGKVALHKNPPLDEDPCPGPHSPIRRTLSREEKLLALNPGASGAGRRSNMAQRCIRSNDSHDTQAVV